MSDEFIEVDPGVPAPEQPADAGSAERSDAAPSVDEQVAVALADDPTETAAPASDPSTDAAAEPSEAAAPGADLKAIVEALIFASPDPVTPKTLYKLLATESKDAVSAAINELRAEYLDRPGLVLVEVAGGYQIVTRPELHEWVRRLFHERSTQKLSVAALESLAVIAYRQPVTALEITDIRGVNTSGVLSTLLERNLIKIVGRKNVVGRPFMYGTTKEFLIRFGLKDLGDLPKIEDMAEALGFNPPAGLVERPAHEEVLPLNETEEGAPPASPEGVAPPPSDEPPDPVAS
jgi:segregation and condensation protein B